MFALLPKIFDKCEVFDTHINVLIVVYLNMIMRNYASKSVRRSVINVNFQ